MIPLTLAAAALCAAALLVVAYFAWLVTAPRRTREAAHHEPRVLVVVPVFDEATLIARKLENLAALTYAHKRVVLVDGGSTDGTIAILQRSGFDVLLTSLRDKTAQLNAAIATSDEPWILVTDADALLELDTIERLLRAAHDDVGVVGASVRPESAHELESLHWRATDWLRAREFDRGSAGIVAAPCYLARREHLLDLPADAIADDVHVACRAMRAGQRVAHSDASVIEMRSPRNVRDLLRHKFRKADAYLREIFRFLPSRMPAVFFWRATLLTLVPLIALCAAPFTLVALFFKPTRLALLLTAVSAAALLRYPFSRQAASFPKIQYEEP
ncbi:MAG TPA: glycosyltransferase [Thermoanaerobaculia bacterium]|nr:glycosyltransferase [Thermoanaerobaculia bacterium]